MKATGIVRRIDELGRFVIPKELRDTFNINPKDDVEMFTEDDKIILKKFQRTCTFCGSAEDIIEYKGKAVCSECMSELQVKDV